MKYDKIREIRQSKGLTQDELAKMTGLTQGFIGNIENGRKRPSVDSLVKIAKALKVNLGRLI